MPPGLTITVCCIRRRPHGELRNEHAHGPLTSSRLVAWAHLSTLLQVACSPLHSTPPPRRCTSRWPPRDHLMTTDAAHRLRADAGTIRTTMHRAPCHHAPCRCLLALPYLATSAPAPSSCSVEDSCKQLGVKPAGEHRCEASWGAAQHPLWPNRASPIQPLTYVLADLRTCRLTCLPTYVLADLRTCWLAGRLTYSAARHAAGRSPRR